MSEPTRGSEVPAESVRTPSQRILVGSLCPICRRTELRGRQTVCSPACRRERSRQKDADQRQRRDDEIRVLAVAARQAIEALERRLAQRTTRSTKLGRTNPMTAWRAILIALCVAVLAPSSTAAQGVSPEAKELARLSLSSGQFDRIGTQAGRIGVLSVQRAIEDRLGRKLTEDEFRRLAEVFTRVFKETIPQSEFEENLAGQFDRYYSPPELTELVAFYRTPLGMKALRFTSTVAEENALFVQRLTATREAQLTERFNAEFAREFPKLSEELQRKQRQ